MNLTVVSVTKTFKAKRKYMELSGQKYKVLLSMIVPTDQICWTTSYANIYVDPAVALSKGIQLLKNKNLVDWTLPRIGWGVLNRVAEFVVWYCKDKKIAKPAWVKITITKVGSNMAVSMQRDLCE